MAVDDPPPPWQTVDMSTTATRTEPHALLSTDLVGVSELATRAHVKVGTVQAWRIRHPSFPAPVLVLSMGAIWSWPDVAAWLAVPRPPGPRPRTRP
jgi:hypothetical protein